MATLLVAIAVATRYLSPHYVFPQYKDLPVVPAITALMMLAVMVGLLRKKVTFGFPTLLVIQWVLFGWAALCLVVNDGFGSLEEMVESDYLKDIVFVTTMIVAVDRLSRLKILVATITITMLLIGAFALPQTWGHRYCAEWKEGDMANLVVSKVKCHQVSECFSLEHKIPRAFDGIGSRNWRCERRGPFAIAAYIGRIRWTGTFDDSNNLGGAIAMLVPLLMAWFWRDRRRLLRWGWPLAALFFTAVIVATGSRGAQLALVSGAGLTLWGLWGRRAIYVGAALVALALIGVLVFGKTMVREEDRFEGSTDVSDRFRRDAMNAGYRLWTSHPFFGVGYDRFERYHDIDPHNAYLASAGETGTLGLLIYGLGVFLLFKAGWVVWRKARAAGHKELERFALGVLGANTAGLLSLAMFLSTYDKLSWLVPLAFTTGLLREAKRELPELELSFGYQDALISIPVTLLVVGVVYVGLMASYTFS